MRSTLAALSTSLFLSAPVAADPVGGQSAVGMTIAPRNLRPTGGHLRCLAFASPRGFPDTRRFAAVEVSIAATSADAACHFPALEPGLWAFAFIHDADDDGRLDTNLFGVPTEGYGFSRDASGTFGPPDFEDAAVRTSNEHLVLRPRLRY